MAADKILSLLGLARRAGKLEAGYNACTQAARDHTARLLAAAEDISEKTYKNLCYEAEKAQIPVFRLRAGQAEVGRACGVKAGVLAVTDRGFSKALVSEMEREKEERSL